MKNLFNIIILLVGIAVVGCGKNKYESIHEEELEFAFIVNSSPTFKGYYYHGSDEYYHYFESRWSYGFDRYFKLNKKSLKLNEVYSFDEDELKLDVISFSEEDSIFGYNEFYQLYYK